MLYKLVVVPLNGKASIVQHWLHAQLKLKFIKSLVLEHVNVIDHNWEATVRVSAEMQSPKVSGGDSTESEFTFLYSTAALNKIVFQLSIWGWASVVEHQNIFYLTIQTR